VDKGTASTRVVALTHSPFTPVGTPSVCLSTLAKTPNRTEPLSVFFPIPESVLKHQHHQAMSSSLAVWAISAVVAIAAAAPLDCDVCSEQTAEHCSLFPSSPACKTRCGFVWDTATSRCVIEGTEGVTAPLIAKGNGAAPPIIGGQGKYR
jgi:hypothetical protein